MTSLGEAGRDYAPEIPKKMSAADARSDQVGRRLDPG